MKHREKVSMPAIGGSSLLVIFGVLCLVIFSLLSLSTVLAESRLSEAAAQRTQQWYAADLKAQEMFARLRSGEMPDGVEQTEAYYRYSVPVSENQTLQVILQETDNGWEVIVWQIVPHPEDGDTTLPVWQGS